ncbi:sieve element occlusion B-like protein [Tanacetum coccineum]
MLRAFPVSLTGSARRWLRNQPSGSITTWEALKTKFLNKYCPPARTAKKIEETNNFQQNPMKAFLVHGKDLKNCLSEGAIPSKTAADAKIAIQEMAEYSQKWHNGTSSRTRRSDANMQGPQLYEGLSTKGKKEITLEELLIQQFGAPYQPEGQYRGAGPGFYQQNNGNSLYPDQRPSLEESLTKFMAESAKRHEENSNIIK